MPDILVQRTPDACPAPLPDFYEGGAEKAQLRTLKFVVSPLGVKRWQWHKAAWFIETLSQFQRATPEGDTTNT
jgi:hypothetical protein